MDVVILGHRGMLGHMVKQYLIDKHCTVLTCDYRYPTNEFKDFIKNYHGDFIINCIGAIPQRTKEFSINYELPVWLDIHANCSVIHPGTDCEMDLDDYGISKKSARDYIVNSGYRTKILKTSIIGPELNSAASLFEWFLSQDGHVYGYTNVMWNGNTTLEWAMQCYKLMCDWESYKIETILEGECLSKFELLKKIQIVFQKEIQVLDKTTEGVNKCLIGDIKTPGISEQLIQLKKYYYDRR